MNPFDDLHRESQRWKLEDEGIDLTFDGDFLSKEEADEFFEALKTEIEWRRTVVQTPGGPKTVPRMISWHADPGLTYSYSGLTHQWQPWTETLQKVRDRLEDVLGVRFNGCLANFYENERDSVSMHADDEEDMESGAPIASVSLGETREFVLKHVETGARYVLPLDHGSLLVMAGDTQKVSRHGVPKSRRSCSARINLTFRVTREKT
jgi:alkylated DNA repair dioxygenase AlkB